MKGEVKEMIKRLVDIVFAGGALLALCPLYLAVSIMIRVSMGPPVLFRQSRVGYREHIFTLYKFRTMREVCGPDGEPLPDAARLTPLGAWLRRTSLDELPQLWNVLKGDMSIVGPRPLYPHYLPFYTPRERMRHQVRPGITGLAQVAGRNALSWDERLELDAQYVEQQSLFLDLKIILITILKVIRREGVIVIPGSVQGPLDQVRRRAAL